MSNQLAIQDTTDIIQFDDSKVALIRRLIAKDATPDEFDLFMHQCRRTGLDPLAKQIYFMKYGGKMTIITAIDGYRLIAMRTGVHSGTDDAVFDGRQTFKNKNVPSKASVTVYRNVGGQRVGFTASAYWDEFCPSNGGQWLKMPHVMLAKVAEAAALRKAFPADLSGMYTNEEMDQATITTIAPPSRQIDTETGVIDGDFEEPDFIVEDAPPFVPESFDEPEPEVARNESDTVAFLNQEATGADWKGGEPSAAQLKAMQSNVRKLVGGKAADASLFLKVVYGLESSKDSTKGQCSALLDWIGATKENGYTQSAIAMQEARSILTGETAQAMASA